MAKKKFSSPELNEIEALTTRLLHANQKLEAFEKSRTELLANISHDLRAPVTAIRSSIDYLTTCDSNTPWSEVQSILHLMDIRTATLESLIQNFYYLFSLDAGSQTFHFERIQLAPFLEEYFFTAKIEQKYEQRHLFLDIPSDMEAIVHIDPHPMIRVLDNLFTNALKYSHIRDSITLGARSEGNQAVFWVKDTGIGIPKEDIDRIFERTVKLDSSRGHENNGGGLGLAIVKSILECHHGTIHCESQVGKGSCFIVTLPVSVS